MSAALPNLNSCCSPCEEPTSVAVPGPQGPAGEDGTNGTDGVDAFTTADSFIMPAELANVTVDVVNSEWMTVGQVVFAQGGGSVGYFEVQSKPDDVSVILKNLEDTANDAYSGNSAPATVFPALTAISPAGLQGPAGAAPAGGTYFAIANNLNEGVAATMRANLGLGTMAVQAASAVAITGGTITGITDLAVADGGTGSSTQAGARTNLGLGTMAVQNASAVAITGGALNGTLGATTPAAAEVTTLGVLGDLKLYGYKFFSASTPIQSLLAATTIAPDACKVSVVGNGGARVLIGTPTIAPTPSFDGQHLFVFGTDDTNTITLQDEAGLPGSKLNLGAATRVLGKGDIIHLLWDLNEAAWFEVSYSDN